MSSLTTCSGQGVVIQGKGNEKECVVEDIENKSSQQPLSGTIQSVMDQSQIDLVYRLMGRVLGSLMSDSR